MTHSDREVEHVTVSTEPDVMTIKTAGHESPLLTIESRESLVGDITDGVGFRHHSKDSAGNGAWVMSFSDLEKIYKFVVAARTGRNSDRMRPSHYERIVPAALRLVINDESKRMRRAVALLDWMQESLEQEDEDVLHDYAEVVRAARDIVNHMQCRLCPSNIAHAMAVRDQALREALHALVQDGQVSDIEPTVEPERTEQSETSERCKQLEAGIDAELSQLHETNAALIDAQFAITNEAEFDVSGALDVIIKRVERTIATLNQLASKAAP